MCRAKLLVVGCLLAAAASAELQNVEVGGEIVIRARYWNNVYSNAVNGPAEIRIPPFFLPARPIGPFGANSRYDWSERGHDLDFVEMDTRINVTADFTNNVTAFIELESFDIWGTDFRSNYRTGADFAAASVDDVEVYQAYIEATEMFGYPLRLRIGRQEMELGKGWLVDDITTAIFGRSWDMARLGYGTDQFHVDAWYSILADNTPLEEDEDITFAGVYGTYTALEPIDISAYWLWVRDGTSINDTNFVAPVEALEDLFGIDDYDPTNMHTVGLRAFGGYNAFDYDWELAYQFGNADSVGAGFRPFGLYGDDAAEFDAFATDLEVGYTFDMLWTPRVFLGGAFFEGEDNRDISFLEWLSPFDQPEASVSFNRLFPGTPYSLVMEIGQDMSNFWQVRGGVNFQPTDKVSGLFKLAYFGVDETFDWPRHFVLGRYRVPIAPNLSFWTQESDDEIGWTTLLSLRYDYTEDLMFRVVWEHLFTGDGLADGSFLHRYGLEFSGGRDQDDADYIHLETRISF